MNSRERMRRFLAGEHVDRIPNGLGGCETAGLHNLAYEKLKHAIGAKTGSNRVCTFMNNAVFDPEILSAIEADIVLLGSRMNPSRFWGPEAAKEWKRLEIWGLELQVAKDWKFSRDPYGTWRWGDSVCHPGSYYFDRLPSESQAGEILDGPPPSPKDFNPPHELPESLLKRLEEDARWLYENTGFCVSCGEMIQDLQLKPGGTQAWWMLMASEPETCHEFLDKAVDASLAQLKQLDQAVGKYCQILGIADDMGDSRGVMVGPDLWREIYKPHYKRLFTEWRKISSMKVNLHSCGAISEILEDLIECGVQIYNPVQTSAKGMEPAGLKKRFGEKLVFYGGSLDAISVSPSTPPEEVYSKVKANIEALSKGGSYIFAGVHNLPAETSSPQLEAALSAYRDCRERPELN